mgnify:CR=1 FL=1
MLMTPVQIARVYAAVANGGKLVTPHLNAKGYRKPEDIGINPAKLAIVVYIIITMTQGFSEVLKCWYRFKTKVDLWHDESEVDVRDQVAAESEQNTGKGA